MNLVPDYWCCQWGHWKHWPRRAIKVLIYKIRPWRWRGWGDNYLIIHVMILSHSLIVNWFLQKVSWFIMHIKYFQYIWSSFLSTIIILAIKVITLLVRYLLLLLVNIPLGLYRLKLPIYVLELPLLVPYMLVENAILS